MIYKEFITIAILAKDKAHVLPLYLKQIESQTYPKSRIRLFIRTNNNRDDTATLLKQWVQKAGHRYSEVYFDSSDVKEPVQKYSPHEWNTMRFKVLARLRQDSIEWAKARGTHYFVADCDNFIIPETIEMLLATGLPVISPMLVDGDDPSRLFSNFHPEVDENGYFKYSDTFCDIYNQKMKGLIEVGLVHCTYLIRNEVLNYVKYDDGSGRHEYVIFSDVLRKSGIPQYVDNRRCYGKVTFCDTKEDFKPENFEI